MKNQIVAVLFTSLLPLNVFAELGTEQQGNPEQSHVFLSAEAVVALDCLVDLDSIAQIDSISTLVSQLKPARKPAQKVALAALARQIKNQLGAFTALLSGRSSQLNLTIDEVSYSVALTNAEKLVRRAASRVRAKGLKRRRLVALEQLSALRTLINPVCDDGNFCNGNESCDLPSASCQSSGDPCLPPLVCNEASNACDAPTGKTFALTLSQDVLNGTDQDDLFTANLEFNPPTASSLATLQTADTLDGGPGFDTLNAVFNFTSDTTVSPFISEIEAIGITDVGTAATSLDFANILGVSEVNIFNSTNSTPVALTGLSSLINLRLANQTVGAQLTFSSSATSGSSDALQLAFSNQNGGTVTIATSANGLESLNIVSDGAKNFLTELLQSTATTLSRINFFGAAPFMMDLSRTLPATVTTVDTTGASASTVFRFSGASSNDLTVNGGAGDDTVIIAGNYSPTDIINGGGGINTLGLNAAQAVQASAQSNVSDIRNLQIVNTLLGEIVDITKFGAESVILDTIGSTLLLNLPSTIIFGPGDRTIVWNNDDLNDQVNLNSSGTGTADTLIIQANNADQSFAATAISPNGFETVIYSSNNGPDGTPADLGSGIGFNANTLLNLTLTPTAGTGTVIFTGNVPVVVFQSIRAGVVDASGLGAALIMETTSAISALASGVTITGSVFGDELVGSSSADIIIAGDGNDQIKGRGGIDAITTGAGMDRVYFDILADFGDTIADFTPGLDQIGISTVIMNFTGIAGTEASPVAFTAAQFETGRASIAQIVGGDQLKVVRLSAAQTSAALGNDVGTALATLVLAFDLTLQRGILIHDADWSNASGRTIVARLDSIRSLQELQAITFDNFLEID